MFGLVKAHFGLLGPKKSLPSGQTVTYQKNEGIQSCLRTWGRYDPIGSGPSEPKKNSDFVSVAEKKLTLGPKMGPGAHP